jgi:hypothetical protein
LAVEDEEVEDMLRAATVSVIPPTIAERAAFLSAVENDIISREDRERGDLVWEELVLESPVEEEESQQKTIAQSLKHFVHSVLVFLLTLHKEH